MRPLLTDKPVVRAGDSVAPYTAGLIYSDNLIDRLAARCPSFAPARGPDSSEIRMVRMDDHRDIYVDAGDGLAWFVDRNRREVLTVHASRTEWPPVQLANIIQEISTRYLEDQGWILLHASAVSAKDGVFICVGDSGAGKTTLMAALMDAGCAYVANERCFVRTIDDKPFALGFLMVANIPLPVVSMHKGLRRALLERDDAIYPRRRIVRHRVTRTPEDRWPELPDELQLMPTELCAAMETQPPWQGGPILGLVRPSASRKPKNPIMREMEVYEVRDLLDRNHYRHATDGDYPAWLNLGFSEAPYDPEELLRLSAIEFTFHPTPDGIFGLNDPVDVMRNALDSVGRKPGLLGRVRNKLGG